MANLLVQWLEKDLCQRIDTAQACKIPLDKIYPLQLRDFITYRHAETPDEQTLSGWVSDKFVKIECEFTRACERAISARHRLRLTELKGAIINKYEGHLQIYFQTDMSGRRIKAKLVLNDFYVHGGIGEGLFGEPQDFNRSAEARKALHSQRLGVIVQASLRPVEPAEDDEIQSQAHESDDDDDDLEIEDLEQSTQLFTQAPVARAKKPHSALDDFQAKPQLLTSPSVAPPLVVQSAVTPSSQKVASATPQVSATSAATIDLRAAIQNEAQKRSSVIGSQTSTTIPATKPISQSQAAPVTNPSAANRAPRKAAAERTLSEPDLFGTTTKPVKPRQVLAQPASQALAEPVRAPLRAASPDVDDDDEDESQPSPTQLAIAKEPIAKRVERVLLHEGWGDFKDLSYDDSAIPPEQMDMLANEDCWRPEGPHPIETIKHVGKRSKEVSEARRTLNGNVATLMQQQPAIAKPKDMPTAAEASPPSQPSRAAEETQPASPQRTRVAGKLATQSTPPHSPLMQASSRSESPDEIATDFVLVPGKLYEPSITKDESSISMAVPEAQPASSPNVAPQASHADPELGVPLGQGARRSAQNSEDGSEDDSDADSVSFRTRPSHIMASVPNASSIPASAYAPIESMLATTEVLLPSSPAQTPPTAAAQGIISDIIAAVQESLDETSAKPRPRTPPAHSSVPMPPQDPIGSPLASAPVAAQLPDWSGSAIFVDKAVSTTTSTSASAVGPAAIIEEEGDLMEVLAVQPEIAARAVQKGIFKAKQEHELTVDLPLRTAVDDAKPTNITDQAIQQEKVTELEAEPALKAPSRRIARPVAESSDDEEGGFRDIVSAKHMQQRLEQQKAAVAATSKSDEPIVIDEGHPNVRRPQQQAPSTSTADLPILIDAQVDTTAPGTDQDVDMDEVEFAKQLNGVSSPGRVASEPPQAAPRTPLSVRDELSSMPTPPDEPVAARPPRAMTQAAEIALEPTPIEIDLPAAEAVPTPAQPSDLSLAIQTQVHSSAPISSSMARTDPGSPQGTDQVNGGIATQAPMRSPSNSPTRTRVPMRPADDRYRAVFASSPMAESTPFETAAPAASVAKIKARMSSADQAASESQTGLPAVTQVEQSSLETGSSAEAKHAQAQLDQDGAALSAVEVTAIDETVVRIEEAGMQEEVASATPREQVSVSNVQETPSWEIEQRQTITTHTGDDTVLPGPTQEAASKTVDFSASFVVRQTTLIKDSLQRLKGDAASTADGGKKRSTAAELLKQGRKAYKDMQRPPRSPILDHSDASDDDLLAEQIVRQRAKQQQNQQPLSMPSEQNPAREDNAEKSPVPSKASALKEVIEVEDEDDVSHVSSVFTSPEAIVRPALSMRMRKTKRRIEEVESSDVEEQVRSHKRPTPAMRQFEDVEEEPTDLWTETLGIDMAAELEEAANFSNPWWLDDTASAMRQIMAASFTNPPEDEPRHFNVLDWQWRLEVCNQEVYESSS